MRFELVDRILEASDDRIVTLKNVSAAEEYLQDHFPGFPVLPGVMMLEAMVQASRRLLSPRTTEGSTPLVLGRVRALKYGRFVRPGAVLRVEVVLQKALEGGAFDIKGEARVIEPGAIGPAEEAPIAVSGRLVMRPVRIGQRPNPQPA